jgi:hypothetical protein
MLLFAASVAKQRDGFNEKIQFRKNFFEFVAAVSMA